MRSVRADARSGPAKGAIASDGRRASTADLNEWARRTHFVGGAVDMARGLLGQRLVRIDDHGRRCAGLIVETEAYVGPHDLASHSAGGRRTARNRSMYLPAGHAYVYFVYGLHWCFNVVAEGAEGAEAVLVRALEPTDGLEVMAARRGTADPRRLCAGPARLAQALAIDGAHDGVDLRRDDRIFIEGRESPLGGDPGHGAASGTIHEVSPHPLATTRIGVDYAGAWAARPWRFLLPGADSWWSRPPRRPRAAAGA